MPPAVFSPLINALSNRTTPGYDAAARQISTTGPLGYIVANILDTANGLLASVDPLANRTSFSDDAASRRVAVQKGAVAPLQRFMRLFEVGWYHFRASVGMGQVARFANRHDRGLPLVVLHIS